jgi:hypothetical protein
MEFQSFGSGLVSSASGGRALMPIVTWLMMGVTEQPGSDDRFHSLGTLF